MSEKGSSTPKRAPRRRKVAEADAPEVGPIDVTPEIASRPSPRAIDDALSEAAAARAEYERPPTEADMDFDAPPPPRRGRAPRTRTTSRRAAEAPAEAAPPAIDDADAGPVRAGCVC